MYRIADLVLASLTVLMATLVAGTTYRLARRSGLEATSARRPAVFMSLCLASWLALSAVLSMTPFLSWSAHPPRWPLLPLTAFVAIALLMRARATRRLLSQLPLSWPIYAQTFRVAVELALFALFREGRAPRQVTFEGRNYDILVGLSALLIGWLVSTRRLGRRGTLLWNVVGLAVLANTVGTVATSTPGPLHLDWDGAPLTALTGWPVVWLPAFLMPLAVFLHVVSLWLSGAARARES